MMIVRNTMNICNMLWADLSRSKMAACRILCFEIHQILPAVYDLIEAFTPLNDILHLNFTSKFGSRRPLIVVMEGVLVESCNMGVNIRTVQMLPRVNAINVCASVKRY